MGNCLVTKLNGVIDKDLPIFGTYSIQMWASIVGINSGLKYKAYVHPSNGHFVVNNVDYQTVDVEDGTYVDFVKNTNGLPANIYVYYGSKSLIGVMQINNIVGSDAITHISISQGNIENDPSKGHIQSSGELGNLGRFPNLFTFVCTYMGLITGNITDFGSCIKANNINVEYSRDIIGSLESLGEAQFANGRGSYGTEYMMFKCNGVITYNGVPVTNSKEKLFMFTSSGYTISDP